MVNDENFKCFIITDLFDENQNATGTQVEIYFK